MTTVAVDRGYEVALGRKKLVIESDDEENNVTTPIRVVHEDDLAGVTVRIPTVHAFAATLHNVAIASPTPTQRGARWTSFAIGIVASVATIVAIVVSLH